jgi:hypothetical protein
MATRILSTIGVVLYLTFLVAIKWGEQAATAPTSTAKCSARDAKYVAWFEGLPSQFSIVPTSLTIKEILYKWTHEALISAWNRGTSATRALNAQPPLFRLLATRPNMTWGGLRAGQGESYGKQFQGAP